MKIYKSLIDKYKKLPIQSKSSLWFVFCSVLQQGISVIATPIFTRIMETTEGFGNFSVFQTWKSVITIVVSLNLASGVFLRGLIKYEDDESEFKTSIQSLFLLIFSLFFILYIAFHKWWDTLLEMPTKYMICMLLDILVSVCFHFWSSEQKVKFRYIALITVTLINAFFKPLVAIIAVLNSDDKVYARIYSNTLVDVVIFGCFFIRFFITKGKKISTKYWKYALSYNIPLVPHYLSGVVLNQSDRIMIKKMCGGSDAGIYTLAYTVAYFMTIVNNSITNSFNPWLYKQMKEKKYKEIGPYAEKLLVIVAFCNSLLIILAPEVIRFFAPENFYGAIGVVPPVTMSVYFMFLYSLFSNIEFYFEKTKAIMVASVLGALLNIVLNLIFIRKYGFIAAGYTTLICYVCFALFHYFVMKRILKKNIPEEKIYNIKNMAIITIVFIVVSFCSMLLYNRVFLKYLILSVVLVLAIIFRKKIINQILFIYKNR